MYKTYNWYGVGIQYVKKSTFTYIYISVSNIVVIHIWVYKPAIVMDMCGWLLLKKETVRPVFVNCKLICVLVAKLCKCLF